MRSVWDTSRHKSPGCRKATGVAHVLRHGRPRRGGRVGTKGPRHSGEGRAIPSGYTGRTHRRGFRFPESSPLRQADRTVTDQTVTPRTGPQVGGNRFRLSFDLVKRGRVLAYQDSSLAPPDRRRGSAGPDDARREGWPVHAARCPGATSMTLVTRQNVGSLLHIPPDRMGLRDRAGGRHQASASRCLLADDCNPWHSFWPGATIFGTQLAVACKLATENAAGWPESLLWKRRAPVSSGRSRPCCASRGTCAGSGRRDVRGRSVPHRRARIGHGGGLTQGSELRDDTSMLATAKQLRGLLRDAGRTRPSEADISRRKLLKLVHPSIRARRARGRRARSCSVTRRSTASRSP